MYQAEIINPAMLITTTDYTASKYISYLPRRKTRRHGV